MSTYHSVRPGYVPETVTLVESARTIADVGCGTGKLSEQLQSQLANAQIVGVDSSMAMLREFSLLQTLPAIRGHAEDLPFADDHFDAITCAQTWHWLDAEKTSAEFARVLRPGGKVLLLWNTLDVQVPWVHRLTRITHAGDTLKEGFFPTVHAPLRLETVQRGRFEQLLAVNDLHTLMHTRAYWLRANAATREKMTANLDWYIDYLDLDRGGKVALPYRHDAFCYRCD
ncbi:Phthiotriol/phenolphthiotriol dimycocerosates methyltransferase [Corynebacterium gerontici]|uniref:Phthiotriol/phenolphthiotriol dimycocerosates methyltransferase n=1 Tax=Corynebacterium gerontici TaxID=2079234 RepID=A0A3G6J093_9CORY|nr:Phthiotriol/phenolphthiotriol dimycocerosates methyltransferase [Corynebacterium gerontici]